MGRPKKLATILVLSPEMIAFNALCEFLTKLDDFDMCVYSSDVGDVIDAIKVIERATKPFDFGCRELRALLYIFKDRVLDIFDDEECELSTLKKALYFRIQVIEQIEKVLCDCKDHIQ